MTPAARRDQIVAGVDTYADTIHLAVIDKLGRDLDDRNSPPPPATELPPRDRYLACFETRIDTKMNAIEHVSIRRYVEQFATWHHLTRVRAISAVGKPTRGPVHASKQDVTETIKFLTWLHDTHGRTAANCRQLHVDE